MTYIVNTFDDSAHGMERLRHQSEFILVAYPWEDSGLDDIRQQWLDDIQSCARPDGFEYDAARQAVLDWCDENTVRLSNSLHYLQSELDDMSEYDESPAFRLYVECVG